MYDFFSEKDLSASQPPLGSKITETIWQNNDFYRISCRQYDLSSLQSITPFALLESTL